jgi:1-acyl-sn-glycerol-3-phosphate acyltransferase
MLYPLTRPLARITLSVFYRRIYWINANRLPRDRPVILASNHPTAFIEPCIFACWLDRPLHFIVRGNLFRKAWAARLLRDLHMIPVYRKKDGGMEEIKKNFSSLAEAEQVLLQNRTLHILAEGHTVHEKRLRPLRKGAARLGTPCDRSCPGLRIDNRTRWGQLYVCQSIPLGGYDRIWKAHRCTGVFTHLSGTSQ